MAQADLMNVSGGDTVTVTTGSADGGFGPHTHTFSIKKYF